MLVIGSLPLNSGLDNHFLLLQIYPISSLNSLQAFNCHKTLGVIQADFRMECAPLFSFMGLYSLACFAIFPLGIPFLFYKALEV